VSTKCKLNILNIILKVVNKLPSNMAHSVSDKYLTMWFKVIHFTLRTYAHYFVKL